MKAPCSFETYNTLYDTLERLFQILCFCPKPLYFFQQPDFPIRFNVFRCRIIFLTIRFKKSTKNVPEVSNLVIDVGECMQMNT